MLLQVFDLFNDKPEKSKAYIMESGEDGETDVEGMKLFNCDRYTIHAMLSQLVCAMNFPGKFIGLCIAREYSKVRDVLMSTS